MLSKTLGKTTSNLPNRDIPSENKVITPRQSASLIASTVLGVGILTISRSQGEVLKEGAWIATLLGGLISLFFLYIISRLSYRFPLKSFAVFTQEILGTNSKQNRLGKWLALPLILCLIAYWGLVIAITVRTFSEVVVSALLPTTPLEVIILTMLALSFLLTCYEIEVVARVNELILPLIVIPLILITISSAQRFKPEFFLPLWPDITPYDLLQGVIIGTFSYIGYEVIMVFGAYTMVSKETVPFNLIAFLAIVLIYTAIVILTIGSFGIYELDYILWPTLELVKFIQVPGVILERVESAFLAVWMAAAFTTSANILYAASFLAKKLINKGPAFIYALILLPFIYWVALMPQNVFSLFEWTNTIGYLSIFFSGLLPLLLYIIARFRKIGLPPSKQLDHLETHTEGR